MFATYSLLALYLSLVSALQLSVPDSNLPALTGASLQFDLDIGTMDPTHIDLLLCVSDGSFYRPLASNVVVASTMEAEIPGDVPSRPDYFLAATAVGNIGIIYSKSTLFEIQDSQS